MTYTEKNAAFKEYLKSTKSPYKARVFKIKEDPIKSAWMDGFVRGQFEAEESMMKKVNIKLERIGI